MNYSANKLLEIALAEEGYFEKKSLSMLDEKTANAGSGNYTKYARDLYEAGYYNGNKQGVAWCSVFVDWCHYMAAGKNKSLAQRISCQSGVYGAGCTYSMNYYKAAGRFYTQAPRIGDQIYFGTGKSAEHTGIVCKVDENRVYTVEGNTSSQSGVVSNGGGVFCKSYPLNHSRILGYGRPNYSEDREVSPFSTVKKGDQGAHVRALQILLAGNGCSCGVWGADGNFGSSTEKALLRYQNKMALQADGMAGPETWKMLLGIA